jgi:hypothetical protein
VSEAPERNLYPANVTGAKSNDLCISSSSHVETPSFSHPDGNKTRPMTFKNTDTSPVSDAQRRRREMS